MQSVWNKLFRYSGIVNSTCPIYKKMLKLYMVSEIPDHLVTDLYQTVCHSVPNDTQPIHFKLSFYDYHSLLGWGGGLHYMCNNQIIYYTLCVLLYTWSLLRGNTFLVVQKIWVPLLIQWFLLCPTYVIESKTHLVVILDL